MLSRGSCAKHVGFRVKVGKVLQVEIHYSKNLRQLGVKDSAGIRVYYGHER
jgi:hypothetical protein